MSIFFWLLIVFAAFSSCCSKHGFHENYTGAKNVQPIKGLFILLVFLCHFVQYIPLDGVWDQPFTEIRRNVGQLVVVPFLFYSGYGVAESIRSKGLAYVKRMPVHRILKVLFQFDVAIVLFLILSYMKGITYTPRRILYSFFGWGDVGNSNWYVFAILYLYAATWFAFTVFRKRRLAPYLCVTALVVLYVVFLEQFSDKGAYWYNTIAAYVAGMWFAYGKRYFDKTVFAGNKPYGISLAVLAVLFLLLYPYRRDFYVFEAMSVLFAGIVVLLSGKIRIRSAFLSYCGDHLFSLFILQRLPMIALDDTAIEQTPYLYLLVCLGVTFLLSWVFDAAVSKLWNLLTGRK